MKPTLSVEENELVSDFKTKVRECLSVPGYKHQPKFKNWLVEIGYANELSNKRRRVLRKRPVGKRLHVATQEVMLRLIDEAVENHLVKLQSYEESQPEIKKFARIKSNIGKVNKLLPSIRAKLADDQMDIIDRKHAFDPDEDGGLPSLAEWQAAWQHMLDIFKEICPSGFTIIETAPVAEVEELRDGQEWVRVSVDGEVYRIEFVQEVGTDYPFVSLSIIVPDRVSETLRRKSRLFSRPSLCDAKGVIKLNYNHPAVEVIESLEKTEYDREVRWDY